MKTKLIIWSFLVLGLFFIACNKDDDQEIISESPVNIYKGESNSNDGLQADVSDGDYKTYFYGDFHQNGSPKNIKSIVLEKKQSDTLYNFLVDNQHRIYMAYTSLKNGNKLSRLVKMNFVDDNNAFMNFYDYNWNNNTDILVKQIAVNYENQTAISTYGKFDDDDEFMFSTNEIKKFLIKHSGIIGGVAIVATALTCGGSAGLACGPALLAVSTAVMILKSNIVKADTLNPNLPSHPQSPASEAIPNPTGTPSDPIGYQVKLTATNLTKTGMYNGNEHCYGSPLNVYYTNFSYSDIHNKIKNDLSNLRITITFENNGCFGTWDTSSNAQIYFANYPITFNNSTIKVPTVVSLGATNSNWAKISVYFIDSNTGNQISNVIKFDVQRGINYP